MSDIFFEEMQIPKPDYNLHINSLSHGAMTGQMLEGIEKILLTEKPDWVLVHGDTNSTLAGALAAKKLHLKIAHIESGLRSFNMLMPEEVNRILTDRMSDILFCPTQNAIENLYNEGYKNIASKIVITGDVMYDAALFYAQQSKNKSTIIDKLSLTDYVLATIHRAENTDDEQKLKSIINTLNYISKKIPVVVPLHPRTEKIISKLDVKTNFTIIEPVGYLDMISLLQNCKLVITDSGGLQKESYFFNKNCVTLREQTEWVELVEHGFSICAGADEEKIISAFEILLHRKNNFDTKLYGNGNAAGIMLQHLN
jgi:UDP-GlcNAc3NAcA epimerase